MIDIVRNKGISDSVITSWERHVLIFPKPLVFSFNLSLLCRMVRVRRALSDRLRWSLEETQERGLRRHLFSSFPSF